VKAFNTLTAGFQGSAAGRNGEKRVAMFMCGDDSDAKETVAKLIDDAGFAPVDVGGLADAAVMEAPRREGAVYGEEFTKGEAREFLEGRGGG
jgi:predicted dinucleotide-binding enzyme